MFKPSIILVSVITSNALLLGTSYADTFEVTITNATKGQFLTPPVAITHNSNHFRI
jgi:hypothetical protein